ncbi:PREDICTED: protein LOW PSII ACCUMULATION 2, chloroplastic [Tarenaya hassleriana]|uniref:protein LOW PSII ACCUMULATION 2, chloroplastic n=1 Tax=Tarenaya hassleriana TaxID=28532 RepID=UPI00053C222C|nr:PREDICTED: protein LOW PSII ACCUMULATION 2, chloroplastic [Tarenaya hassleriana]
MALQACFFAPKPYHLHRLFSSRNPNFAIKSQNSQIETDTSEDPETPKKSGSSGLGFGSSSSSSDAASTAKKSNSVPVSGKKKTKGKRVVVRRSPVEKPVFATEEEAAKAEEQRRNESAFLLAWLGLGGIILIEGIVLAASGFLPEEWDKFFVKYLYPVFTPTVGLFVAGTVAYGVLKYVQNEKLKEQK